MLTLVTPDTEALTEAEIDRILTQYRESPKLIHVMRTYLGKISEVMQAIGPIPDFFDLDTAVGDQLTLLGKELGWPREHCICNTQPVFGFECEGFPSEYTVTGFCDGAQTWADCGPFGLSQVNLVDDELYRKFLKVRRYQMLSLYSLQDLTTTLQIFWGDTARVLDAGHGRVVIGIGRDMTAGERSLLQLYPRVLPVAPGIRIRFHFGTLKVFGFGEGWGEFCEPWGPPEGMPIIVDGEPLVTEDGDPILTGPLTQGAPWMCEIDPMPYDCPGY